MALFYLYLFTFHLQPYKIKFDSTGLVGVSLFTCESAEAAQLSTLTAVAGYRLNANVETCYFTQLKLCYLMSTFRCPSDILITSWLFTARWSTYVTWKSPGPMCGWVGRILHPDSCTWFMNHDPNCLFYPSDLSLCLSVNHFSIAPIDNMVLFHGMVCDG